MRQDRPGGGGIVRNVTGSRITQAGVVALRKPTTRESLSEAVDLQAQLWPLTITNARCIDAFYFAAKYLATIDLAWVNE